MGEFENHINTSPLTPMDTHKDNKHNGEQLSKSPVGTSQLPKKLNKTGKK